VKVRVCISFRVGNLNELGGQAYRGIIGWMTRIVKSVMIARAYFQLGEGSIIVGYAVSILSTR
jgi:hypothetical protein